MTRTTSWMAAACAAAWCLAPRPAGAAATPVETVAAARRKLVETLETTGDVAALKRVTVFSKVTGVIEKLPVERGMRLERGAVIAVVEHRAEMAQRKELLAAIDAAKAGIAQAEAAVGVAKASLAQAEAQLDHAKIEKTRAENLYEQNSMPKQRYDSVMSRYRVALAGRDLAAANVRANEQAVEQAKVKLAQAQAALERLDTRIADYTIRAPIAGVVSRRFVDLGAMDTPSQPIVEILDVSGLKVNCDIAQVSAGKVRVGQRAVVTADAFPGERFEGRAAIVDPSLDPQTRTLAMELRVDGRGRLKPGMFVNVSLALGEKTALAVPMDALMRLPGTGVYYLFAVKDGKAEKRTVELGLRRGNFVEILSGVREGERVVVRGQGGLRAGMKVTEAR